MKTPQPLTYFHQMTNVKITEPETDKTARRNRQIQCYSWSFQHTSVSN